MHSLLIRSMPPEQKLYAMIDMSASREQAPPSSLPPPAPSAGMNLDRVLIEGFWVQNV
jgi:hypothetical protein